MDPLQLSIVCVVGFADLVLGGLVLFRNWKNRINRLFAAAAAGMVLWLVINFLCDQPMLFGQALLLNRLAIAAACVMTLPLFAFAATFPGTRGRFTPLWIALLAPTPVFAVVAASTGAIVRSVEIKSWGTNITQGWLFPYMTVWVLALLVALGFRLTRGYREAQGREKVQFKFIFLALGMFLVVSTALSVVLPTITGTNELAKYNPFASMLFLGLTGYAIAKHRLMDLRYVMLRGAAYSVLMTAVGAMLVLPVVVLRISQGAPAGNSADTVFFLSAMSAVLLFQPLRRYLEQATDRVFYRRRYDPQALLAKLTAALASSVDLDEIGGLVARTLPAEMKLAFADVVYVGRSVPSPVFLSDRFPIKGEGLDTVIGACRTGALLVADELPAVDNVARLLVDHGVRVMVPLMSDGALVGALAVGDKQSGDMFSMQDVQFLEVVGHELAISVKTAELFEEKTQRVRELTALNRLASVLGRDLEPKAVLDRALAQVIAVTHAEAGSIMLLDAAGESMTVEAAKGLSEDIIASTRVRLGEGIAGWVAAKRRPLILVGGDDERFDDEMRTQKIASALCVPLLRKDKVIGVLNVSRTESKELFTSENLKVVSLFAGQLAVAVENAKLYVDLENTFLGTIAALAAAVDAKDPYTYGHSSEVTDHALAIADEMGLDAGEQETLRIAAVLHDIGKIGVDGSILHKPGRLTEDEFEVIKTHPNIAANILTSLDFLHDVVPLVQHHHERWNGGGYPSGIAGEEIPLGARIICVADAYNAMTSDRPYRKALSVEKALSELREHAGSQFDPVVVDAMLAVLSRVRPMPAEETDPVAQPAAPGATVRDLFEKSRAV